MRIFWDRLTVGHATLTRTIEVRILVPERPTPALARAGIKKQGVTGLLEGRLMVRR